MNYGSFLEYQFALECPSSPWKDHLCVMEEEEKAPEVMDCLKDCKANEPVAGEPIHGVWFYKVSALFTVRYVYCSSISSHCETVERP